MLKKGLVELIVNLSLRGVFGVLAIHFMNIFCLSKGFPAIVGINFVTIPIVAALGMPGLGVLYIFGIFW